MSKKYFKFDCEFFNGFKPCHHQSKCHECSDYKTKKPRCLVINYDALGDVLRTSLLAEPLSQTYDVYWITSDRAVELIEKNPFIKKILTDKNEREVLNISFDTVFNFDKSLHAGFLFNQIKCDNKQGFWIDENLSIRYKGSKFQELYEMGLDDEIKFRTNKKPMNQLLVESIGETKFPRYQLFFTKSELAQIKFRRDSWKAVGRSVVGVNVGCSKKYPLKKLSFDLLLKLCIELQKKYQVVLLGGLEDLERIDQLKQNGKFIVSPLDLGLRDGALSIAACDLIVTGDTLALHLAVASEVRTIAWFGLSCEQEIDLYGKGEKILAPVTCGPCWKQACDQSTKCNELVRISDLLGAVDRQLNPSKKSVRRTDLTC